MATMTAFSPSPNPFIPTHEQSVLVNIGWGAPLCMHLACSRVKSPATQPHGLPSSLNALVYAYVSEAIAQRRCHVPLTPLYWALDTYLVGLCFQASVHTRQWRWLGSAGTHCCCQVPTTHCCYLQMPKAPQCCRQVPKVPAANTAAPCNLPLHTYHCHAGA